MGHVERNGCLIVGADMRARDDAANRNVRSRDGWPTDAEPAEIVTSRPSMR